MARKNSAVDVMLLRPDNSVEVQIDGDAWKLRTLPWIVFGGWKARWFTNFRWIFMYLPKVGGSGPYHSYYVNICEVKSLPSTTSVFSSVYSI